MKKLMYLAMAAVLLMACDPNGRVDVPGNDKKALNQSAAKALTMIGGSATQVDKDLLNLGFTKTILMEGAPARFNQPAMAQTTPEPPLEGMVYYLLNVPSKFLVTRGEERRDVISEIVDSKHAGIVIAALYGDNKLQQFNGSVFANADIKGVNNLYVGLSNAMYAGLPSKAERLSWSGFIGQSGETRYEQRADFEKALASFEAGEASEGSIFLDESKKVYYSIAWYAPDSEERKSIEKEGVLPFCEGIFSVSLPDGYEID